MKRLAIYCGSATPADPVYIESARAIGTALAERGIAVVYGGGRLGLMGAVADSALEAGGEVIGAIPEALVDAEVAHRGLTELHVVKTMHERKQAFTDLSDGFVTIPGGTGTMDELWEALSWAQLGYHAKPVGLLNVAGYYDGLIDFWHKMGDVGFLRAQHRDILIVDDTLDGLLDKDGGLSAPPDDLPDDRGRTVIRPTREAIVATAKESIDKGSKSFALASRLFDRPTRERAWLLYAWCRACDDLADGQDHGHDLSLVADPLVGLDTIRTLTDLALTCHRTGNAAFDALGIVVAETGMPRRYIDAHIAGFALDAEQWRPRSEADLLRYCWHVAGVVGCMMAVVMGVPPDDEATLERASDLGIAFQLANIARDLSEDDAVGRCYLPEEWLAEMDIPPGQHMKPHFRPRMGVLGKRLADMAEGYETSARIGARALPFRSRWAVLAAAGIYGDIAREVRRRGHKAWARRVVVSRRAKLAWVAKAWWQAVRSRS